MVPSFRREYYEMFLRETVGRKEQRNGNFPSPPPLSLSFFHPYSFIRIIITSSMWKKYFHKIDAHQNYHCFSSAYITIVSNGRALNKLSLLLIVICDCCRRRLCEPSPIKLVPTNYIVALASATKIRLIVASTSTHTHVRTLWFGRLVPMTTSKCQTIKCNINLNQRQTKAERTNEHDCTWRRT